MTPTADRLAALEASAGRLADVVRRLTPKQLASQSYATEWTIADVLSHLGSGAVIMRRRIDSVVSGSAVEESYNQSVWDEWNAKQPAEQASDALAMDRALLDRIVALTDEERASFHFSMGPMSLDLATFVGLRLSEHIVHSWDIDVSVNPGAVLPADAAGLIVDGLGMIVRFTGRSDGRERVVGIHTVEPSRELVLTVREDGLSLEPTTDLATADVELPAEALVRLVYGRLDAAHTPSGVDDGHLDELRALFPGV